MHGDLGTPLVFETMAFPSMDDFIDDWVERTHSEEDALTSHQRGVDYARRKIQEDK